jgi:kynurenine formamidase
MTLDLTLTISKNLPIFPGSPTPQFISWNTVKKDGYNLELLFLSSHSGTHMDSPYHFIDSGKKIHEIPINRLLVSAILIKINKKANQPITKNEIINFEKKHGKIPNNATLIFATGWQKHLQKKHYFENNPGLSLTAANYLASRKINLVGIDSPSIDLGSEKEFSVHKILLKNNILIVENLANLEKIPGNHFNLVVLPLKLKDATGSPVRAIAI